MALCCKHDSVHVQMMEQRLPDLNPVELISDEHRKVTVKQMSTKRMGTSAKHLILENPWFTTIKTMKQRCKTR